MPLKLYKKTIFAGEMIGQDSIDHRVLLLKTEVKRYRSYGHVGKFECPKRTVTYVQRKN